MQASLDRFILAIPYLFLKKIPYAWIAVVALWTWPPIVSGIFLFIIVSGLLMIPKDPKGFTRRIEKLFIAPKDMERFLEQLPHGYGNVI